MQIFKIRGQQRRVIHRAHRARAPGLALWGGLAPPEKKGKIGKGKKRRGKRKENMKTKKRKKDEKRKSKTDCYKSRPFEWTNFQIDKFSN